MKERIIERTVNGIKVTSHIPEDVSESFKQILCLSGMCGKRPRSSHNESCCCR